MAAGATPLLPITKTGPGDKERAYVVRQHCFVKFVLCVLCTVGMLTSVLLLRTYEVRVMRRQSIEGARSHREEEHASHMRVMRLSMLLQRHLEDEVHDVTVLTTYRAWLMRAVGDYQLRVIERSSNCSNAMKQLLQDDGTAFDAEIERLLKLLWDDVVKEGKTAQRALHNITHAIVSELRQDASEQGAYERVMAEAGEEAGMVGYHNHEVEYRGHHAHDRDVAGDGEAAVNPYGEDHFGGEGGEGEGEADGEYPEHADDDDEEHLAGALEALLARLQRNESVVDGLDNATLQGFEELHTSSLRALSDDEQEVDMTRVEAKISKALNASRVPLPPYNASEYDSQLDFLGDVIHRAKLAPYRAELLEMLEGWQAGEMRISKPLHRIEELIDLEVLEPDVLIMHGDYEHYRYDD